MPRATLRWSRAAGLLLCAALVTAGDATAARVATPADARTADRLAAATPGADRDRALIAWAARASLAELMFVLRRPPSDLAGPEARLVRAALDRAPASRKALRRRLGLRLAMADPAGAKQAWADWARGGAAPPARPRASVFRVGALLPDRGDYESYGQDLRIGLEAGFAHHNSMAALPIELVTRATGAGEPARVAAALDSAADESGVLVGELLSVPTIALATGARLLEVPLISPTATDEDVGTVGTAVFQVGPSGLQRGRSLARSVIDSGPGRVGILVSNRNETDSFARGFAALAESLGATIVWRETYATGNLSFREASRAIKSKGVQILFWDGDPREVEALVRQLARDKVSVRMCGGSDLDPTAHHAATRALLEGVQFVGFDWVLAPSSRVVLDSLVATRGEPAANRVHAAGYLAARLIGSAVANGALCPEELSAALEQRVGKDPYLAQRGFFDWAPEEADLVVYVVRGGRAVATQ
jgi:ABC-type branched-subunit amino acid transport system substrate-binding protein